MLVIHGGYRDGFFAWGECSFAAGALRSLRRVEGDASRDHLWAPGAERIAHALADLGCECEGALQGEKIDLRLPTYAEKYPAPSTPLLGEVPTSHMKNPALHSMRPWRIETLPLCPADFWSMRGAFAGRGEASSDGRLLAMGVMAALDLCYLVECCSFAASLVERGRFLPDIKASRGGAKYESAWTPLLIGEDSIRYARLARVMPDAIRTGGGLSVSPPEPVLRGILEDFTDGLIRRAWAGNPQEGRELSPRKIARAIVRKPLRRESQWAEKKKRGTLVDALNPHALWIRSLGWLGETDGLSQSLESIYSDVREWRRGCEWLERVPLNLVLRLVCDEDAWRLEYSLKRLGAGEVVPARDVWRGENSAGREDGGFMRRYLLLMLGSAGGLFPPVKESLELASPESCALSHEDAASFMLNSAADLEALGVEVAYPDWWGENSRNRLAVMGVRGDGEASYRWKLAWRGEILSEADLRAVTGGSPLVRVRGGWAFIPPDHLAEVLRHMEKLPTRLSQAEAVRLAIRDPFIDGFFGLPELESIYGALSRAVPIDMYSAPDCMTCSLRPYQMRGYSWLVFLSGLGIGACLADDMGLGKTIQALALVQKYRDFGHSRPVLLICPTSVIENWRLEIERFFPQMTFYIHHGKDRRKGGDFAASAMRAGMVLSSYALLQRDVGLYGSVDWSGVILDEAQNIKNPDTQQARAVRGIKSDWRVALTGTPIENHVGDIWSIMEFLMPGMLGSRRRFTSTYVKPLKETQDARLAESLRRAISPFIMRRLKTDPDIVPELPKKIQTKVYCGLKKEQAKLYALASNELGREIGRSSGMRRRGLVLAGLTRMKRICDHPSLVARDGDPGCERSSKTERLMSLAAEMFEAGDRALVFTQYVEMGHILKHQLQERFGREAPFLHGSVSREARDKMVRDFQESAGAQFFILSLRAGGVGLNLTRANHVVMFDRWWNPAVETQAIDRAYRIGQTDLVQVHIFCCRGTLEERIDELIASKRELADSVIMESDNWITELSDRELLKLVSLSPRALDS